MNKVFRFGSLLVGLGLCIGCDEPAPPAVDSSMETPAHEQQMTEEPEAAPAEASPEEAAPEATEAAAEAAPEATAPAP